MPLDKLIKIGKTQEAPLHVVATLIGTFCAIVYLAIPTQNYYWDGISFAMAVEGGQPWFKLFHPNHLLYAPLGRLVFSVCCGSTRSLYVLQAMNAILGGVACGLMYCTLTSRLAGRRVPLLLTLVFAFSGTWWRFATDANAYIPSTCLMIACLCVLVRRPLDSGLLSGLLHGLAMCFHQLAVLFLPFALFKAWRNGPDSGGARWSKPLVHMASSAGLTVALYLWAYSISDVHVPFGHWVVSRADDAQFSFKFGKGLLVSARSWVQLFFIGRPSMLDRGDWRSWALVLLSVTAVVIFLVTCWKRRGNRSEVLTGAVFLESLVWLTPYLVFLLVWLPHNTFYKIFALPSIMLLASSYFHATTLTAAVRPKVSRLSAFAAGLVLLNFTFGIAIYARPHGVVEFAKSIDANMEAGTTVLYRAHPADDWYLRYFNPRTNWVQLRDVETFRRAIESGRQVCLETTALDWLGTQKVEPDTVTQRPLSYREFVNSQHRVRVGCLITAGKNVVPRAELETAR